MANQNSAFVTGPITLTGTTETVVLSTTMYGVNNPLGQGIRINGVVNVTGGTGNTNMLIRVRQPDINGAVIGTGASNDSVGAGTIRSIPFDVLDTDDPVGTVNYVLTVQQVAASGNGTLNRASISILSSTATS